MNFSSLNSPTLPHADPAACISVAADAESRVLPYSRDVAPNHRQSVQPHESGKGTLSPVYDPRYIAQTGGSSVAIVEPLQVRIQLSPNSISNAARPPFPNVSSDLRSTWEYSVVSLDPDPLRVSSPMPYNHPVSPLFPTSSPINPAHRYLPSVSPPSSRSRPTFSGAPRSTIIGPAPIVDAYTYTHPQYASSLPLPPSNSPPRCDQRPSHALPIDHMPTLNQRHVSHFPIPEDRMNCTEHLLPPLSHGQRGRNTRPSVQQTMDNRYTTPPGFMANDEQDRNLKLVKRNARSGKKNRTAQKPYAFKHDTSTVRGIMHDRFPTPPGFIGLEEGMRNPELVERRAKEVEIMVRGSYQFLGPPSTWETGEDYPSSLAAPYLDSTVFAGPPRISRIPVREAAIRAPTSALVRRNESAVQGTSTGPRRRRRRRRRKLVDSSGLTPRPDLPSYDPPSFSPLSSSISSHQYDQGFNYTFQAGDSECSVLEAVEPHRHSHSWNEQRTDIQDARLSSPPCPRIKGRREKRR